MEFTCERYWLPARRNEEYSWLSPGGYTTEGGLSKSGLESVTMRVDSQRVRAPLAVGC
jgi:hypothetical protein